MRLIAEHGEGRGKKKNKKIYEVGRVRFSGALDLGGEERYGYEAMKFLFHETFITRRKFGG